MRRDVWIGLVEVRPRPGNAEWGDAPGAYVNAIALADDEGTFNALLRALADLELDAVDFEDVKPFYVRMAQSRPDKGLRELVDEVSHQDPVRFGTFHVFESDDV